MFNNIFNNKKILITGHTGFKGIWLSVWLNLLGAKVYGLSVDIRHTPHYEQYKNIFADEFFIDCRNFIDVSTTIKKVEPDYVFHLAAQPLVSKSFDDPLLTFETNVIGSLNVTRAIDNSGLKPILIVITSDKCYENVEWLYGYRENDKLGGADPYSASKACAEISLRSIYLSYLKRNNIRFATARAGNVIGGGDFTLDRFVPELINNALKGKKSMSLRKPESTRPWQHVLEPLSGYLRLAQYLSFCEDDKVDQKGEPWSFNFGPNSANAVPVRLLGEACLEKLDVEMVLNSEKVDYPEASLLELDINQALHILQWRPVLSFDETIELTCNWYSKFYTNNYITDKQIETYVELASKRELLWTK